MVGPRAGREVRGAGWLPRRECPHNLQALGKIYVCSRTRAKGPIDEHLWISTPPDTAVASSPRLTMPPPRRGAPSFSERGSASLGAIDKFLLRSAPTPLRKGFAPWVEQFFECPDS